MKTYKFVSGLACITLFSVGYVHQHVEIVKSGYRLEQNRESLSNLVDQNSKLAYNLSRLESPRNLLAALEAKEVNFGNQRKWQIANSYLASAPQSAKSTNNNLVSRFLDLFTLSAEAKTRK